VTVYTAQAIHIAVFVRASVARSLSNVRVARVPTGLLGIVGNKGGVAVSFELHKKSFLFVSAHFAAHQEQVRTESNSFVRCFQQTTGGIISTRV
jgi:hypothetical protein